MIIDHDETKRMGVMSLMERGQEERVVEKTLVMAVIQPVQPIATTPSEDKPRPPLDPPWRAVQPRSHVGQFVPAGPCAGLTLYGGRPNTEQNEREPEGVVLTKASADTGTHALPAVEKITGKPSTAAELHRLAKQVQNSKRHLGVSVWYGEHTKEFWVMNAWGLHSFESVTTMNEGMGW